MQDVSFKIVEGGMTAIVGPSGSGKSTLAKLLVSFWEADSGGRILLGGVDVRKLPLSQVMQSVAYVSQDDFLFNVSLRENIRLGRPDATDREVEEAAEAAACGFIKALPGGYDTPAGDAGARLSGGERQRIAIARAMLQGQPHRGAGRGATAFADPENAGVHSGVDQPPRQGQDAGGHCAPPFHHRPGADRIVVMDGGRVSAVGTHAELLQNLAFVRATLGNRIPGHGCRGADMIETIRRLLDFSGRCRKDLLCAFGYGVLYSVSKSFRCSPSWWRWMLVLSPSGGGWFAVAASGGLMGLSVAGKSYSERGPRNAV